MLLKTKLVFLLTSSGGELDYLCVDTSRACSFVSFGSVDDVGGFLHRERRHREWRHDFKVRCTKQTV